MSELRTLHKLDHGCQTMSLASAYALGHEDREIGRLQFQSRIIEPVTRRLIRECGIRPGMRVLDIGCGAGDMSMLLAEAVGKTGRVVAFDREVRVIETAKARARRPDMDKLSSRSPRTRLFPNARHSTLRSVATFCITSLTP